MASRREVLVGQPVLVAGVALQVTAAPASAAAAQATPTAIRGAQSDGLRSRPKTARKSTTRTGATGQPVVFSHGWPLTRGCLGIADVLPRLQRLPLHRA